MTAQVECPHCSYKNIIPDVQSLPAYHILKCGAHTERAGCDKPFAVRTTVEVKAEVYTITKWEHKDEK